jgi:hypothetical protein
MGRDPWPDLSVEIRQRRLRCVPDPDLCLTQAGAAFVRGLAAHTEIWLTPEFLNILDSWALYDREPELLRRPLHQHRARGGDEPGDLLTHVERDAQAAEEVRHALRIWLRLRDEAGRAGVLLHWVRDAPHESCLPAGMEESLLPRWEAMAEALDARLSKTADADSGPLIAAMRDAMALVGVLTGAAVLCRRDPAAPGLPPLLCRHLPKWELPCRYLRSEDELVARDRGMLLNLMVEAGLAGFLWGGTRLAVVRLLVPGEAGLRLGHHSVNMLDEPDFLGTEEPRPIRGAWDGAQAFWYDLISERADAP